jgi:hypothetical protein
VTSVPASPLVSRVLVTWLELTVVGLAGAFLGGTIGGLGAFVVYLATTLLSVGILFHNVNALVTARLAGQEGPNPGTTARDASEPVGEEAADEL